jgi:hypothetical protein
MLGKLAKAFRGSSDTNHNMASAATNCVSEVNYHAPSAPELPTAPNMAVVVGEENNIPTATIVDGSSKKKDGEVRQGGVIAGATFVTNEEANQDTGGAVRESIGTIFASSISCEPISSTPITAERISSCPISAAPISSSPISCEPISATPITTPYTQFAVAEGTGSAGLVLADWKGVVQVQAVVDGGAAADSGKIYVRDTLCSIHGDKVLSLEEANAKLAGARGEMVRLVVSRNDSSGMTVFVEVALTLQ